MLTFTLPNIVEHLQIRYLIWLFLPFSIICIIATYFVTTVYTNYLDKVHVKQKGVKIVRTQYQELLNKDVRNMHTLMSKSWK